MKSHVQVTNCTVIPEQNMPGGGVAIYVCESLLNNCQSSYICLRNISYVDNDCFESIFIELQISKHETINVGCMYRAPNTSLSTFNDNLSFILGNLTSKIVYICGDYNIDLLQNISLIKCLDLNDINWENVMNESNPNVAFSCFIQVLSNTYNDACPVKITTYTGKTKRNDKPW